MGNKVDEKLRYWAAWEFLGEQRQKELQNLGTILLRVYCRKWEGLDPSFAVEAVAREIGTYSENIQMVATDAYQRGVIDYIEHPTQGRLMVSKGPEQS